MSLDTLRIALFTGNYHHIEDGVSRTLGRLVGYLLDQGHEVRIVAPTVPEPPVQAPGTLLAVPSLPIPGRPEYRLSVAFPRSVRRQLDGFTPDLVHIATPDLLGHRALTWGRERRLPVVTTYHTHFPSYLDYYRLGALEPVFWAVGRRFYNRCNEVYVPTPTMADVLHEHGVTSRVRLWPRGIELDRFRPSLRSDDWRQQHGFAPSDVVVTFVSRLVKEKGLDVYVEAVRRLRSGGAPVRALVVGDGPERVALEEALPGAAFTGHLGGGALATAYASSDVFLFPSETETFGNVTLEAMASGLAVVCADAAGSRSLIESGRTGLLCAPRSVDAFTQAVGRLIADADLRQQLGASARESARAYDWGTVLAQMVAFYRGVVPPAA